MDKSQGPKRSALFPVIIFIALISPSKCDSVVTVTEGEVVKLEFPYPCDSDEVTIQIANRAPFYNSAEPRYLNLPNYQLNRFYVEAKDCSLQVEIGLVKRDDEATYICIAYKNGVITGDFIRIRLDVHYPPGVVSCVPSDEYSIGEWVQLHCESSTGSLAGEIVCYQDARRLPPYNELVRNGKTLKQIIWVTNTYPVFCCSSLLDQPKDMCDCKDFAWDLSGSEISKDPCLTATSGQDITFHETSKSPTSPNIKENNQDHPFLPIASSPSSRNKSISSALFCILFWLLSVCAVIKSCFPQKCSKTNFTLTSSRRSKIAMNGDLSIAGEKIKEVDVATFVGININKH